METPLGLIGTALDKHGGVFVASEKLRYINLFEILLQQTQPFAFSSRKIRVHLICTTFHPMQMQSNQVRSCCVCLCMRTYVAFVPNLFIHVINRASCLQHTAAHRQFAWVSDNMPLSEPRLINSLFTKGNWKWEPRPGACLRSDLYLRCHTANTVTITKDLC